MYFIQENIKNGELSNIWKKFTKNGSMVVTGGLYILLMLGASVANFVTQTVVFVTVLYYFITSESGGVMYQILDLIPLSIATRHRCATVLDHTISKILLTTTKTMVFQAMFTHLLFRFVGVHFLYMSTLIALVQGLVPLFPKWISSLPAILQLIVEMRLIEGVVLITLHVYVMEFAVRKIHGNLPIDNEYLTGISIASGMAVFTPPISVCQSLVWFMSFILAQNSFGSSAEIMFIGNITVKFLMGSLLDEESKTIAARIMG